MEEIKIGKFNVSLTEEDGILIRDTDTGEIVEFNGKPLLEAIEDLWNAHF